MGRKRNDSKKKEVHFENAAIQLVVNSTEKPFSKCEDRKEGECEERKEVQEEVQEDEKVDDEVQHEEPQPTIAEPHPTTHLSLLDKVTLGFFVLLNSLGHALKKLARSFLGLFSKDEEERV